MRTNDVLTTTIRVETLREVNSRLLVWEVADGRTVFYDRMWHAIVAVITSPAPAAVAVRRLHLRSADGVRLVVPQGVLTAIGLETGILDENWRDCDEGSWKEIAASLSLSPDGGDPRKNGLVHEKRVSEYQDTHPSV